MPTSGSNSMDAQNYLHNLLTQYSAYVLTEDDKKLVARDLKTYILQKLLRKKFRRQKLHEKTIEDITKKVELSIKENIPLHFILPFGGFKHFSSPAYPYPDWAELFFLKFATDWVSPILEVFKPGVKIEFVSEDMILARMNNYPKKAMDDYTSEFDALVTTYQKYIPDNLQVPFFRVGDRLDKEKVLDEVERLYPNRWEKWEKMTPEEREIDIKRSRRAIMWNGEIDLTHLTDEEKEKRIIESKFVEMTYYDVEAYPENIGEYYWEGNHIPFCGSYGLSPDNFDHWLTLPSTYSSTVDFWIGTGILEERTDGFIPRVVSNQQYQQIKSKLTIKEVTIPELPFQTFKTIGVIKQQDFSQVFP